MQGEVVVNMDGRRENYSKSIEQHMQTYTRKREELGEFKEIQ